MSKFLSILPILDFSYTGKILKFAQYEQKISSNNFDIKISYINGRKLLKILALIFDFDQ